MSIIHELPDQSQMEEDQPFIRKRRPIEEEPQPEVIAECELYSCGCYIYDGQPVYTYDKKPFCSNYHINKYIELECDIA